MYLFG